MNKAIQRMGWCFLGALVLAVLGASSPPPYTPWKAFTGSGGIVISTNPAAGTVVVDGSGVGGGTQDVTRAIGNLTVTQTLTTVNAGVSLKLGGQITFNSTTGRMNDSNGTARFKTVFGGSTTLQGTNGQDAFILDKDGNVTFASGQQTTNWTNFSAAARANVGATLAPFKVLDTNGNAMAQWSSNGVFFDGTNGNGYYRSNSQPYGIASMGASNSQPIITLNGAQASMSVGDSGNNSNRVQLLTGKQGLTIDNTNDDAGDYDRIYARWVNNVARIGAEKNGGGSICSLMLDTMTSSSGILGVNGANQFLWDSTPQFYPNLDGVAFLGLSNRRIGNGFFSQNISGAWEASDVASKTNGFIAGGAYPGATVNSQGGIAILSGGPGSARYVVTNASLITGMILTNTFVTTKGTFIVFTTNGSGAGQWQSGADLFTTATNIATNLAVLAASYCTASASGSNVYIFPTQLAGDMRITTGCNPALGVTNLSGAMGWVSIDPAGSAFVSIGKLSAPSWPLDVSGNAGISGVLNLNAANTRLQALANGILSLQNVTQSAFTRLIFGTNSAAAGYPTMAPSITVSGPNLLLTDQAGTIQSSNSLTVAGVTNIGSEYTSGTISATNAGRITPSTVLGAGNGNTNYTLISTSGKMYLGSSNVNISAAMGYASGSIDNWTAAITNLSAINWGIGFSSVTNRWKFYNAAYGTNAPSVLTNNTLLVLIGESEGTNTLVRYEYFAPGL